MGEEEGAVVEKRKPSKDPANKPLSKKAKRDKFPLEPRKDGDPAQKSAVKVEDNKKSSKQISAKKAPRDDEARQKSAKKCEHKEKHLQKSPTKLENKEKGEKAEQPKKNNPKEKPVDDGQSEMMQQLSNTKVRNGHVSDAERSNNSDLEENDLTYECEEVDHDDQYIEAKEEAAICQPVKGARKRNKPLSRSKGDSAVLVLVKTTSSRKELQMVQEELALKSEGVPVKREHTKRHSLRECLQVHSHI
ncbi:hypothetical protein Cgig2_027325 [Carnegiea gigantea]|uniref:Uncharacterized protein n=1 Tax=Carnegiea gigantea TaxID=171969 RepID=A0A9Q1GGZ9_9CARY|nr:hypothetical protein Cgig2_027325 [Carnegiea gigantea]